MAKNRNTERIAILAVGILLGVLLCWYFCPKDGKPCIFGQLANPGGGGGGSPGGGTDGENPGQTAPGGYCYMNTVCSSGQTCTCTCPGTTPTTPAVQDCQTECRQYSSIFIYSQVAQSETECRGDYYSYCGGGITYQPSGSFHLLSDGCCCWHC